MANKTVFVLTREHNEYDQYGGYFVAAFASKPDIQKLAETMTSEGSMPTNLMEGIAFLEHLRAGGGRRKTEDVWYDLEEVELK